VLEARYRIRLRGAGLVLYRDGRVTALATSASAVISARRFRRTAMKRVDRRLL
jgi:hypothetical protein